MDCFLVKTEHKKRQRAVVRDEDDAFERPPLQKSEQNDQHFIDQLATYIACESGLVKLTDDGNKATYGKPSGDDVYISSGDAFAELGALARLT